ncbi:PTS system, ascorbate-specific IIB component [Carnobacterium iners]|uniref:PTS system, ascorbate-specific IIB component n=1 Tax=Carnobacterium iners TaxID=1073423 RepID=A0A1X7MRE5_9LACT|nr:PTS sugar transporter subunit IIB [Carnobacterium iners]SEK94960.1 PTS system, ascorbate-specific IIB component [Carnobacterium iners]SMH26616.1 PTS system, ascorbate-specific IIB component [Carnobacterium iners]
MIKIVTVCGAGVGSSLMMRLFSQQILDAEGIEANVEASDISSVNPDSYDILITTSDFADALRDSSARIVRIDNMMDKPYLKGQLLETIKNLS